MYQNAKTYTSLKNILNQFNTNFKHLVNITGRGDVIRTWDSIEKGENMNENIQSKLAIEIASKSLTIAKLEAQNEELQAQLQQALDRNAELETSTAPETEKGE